MTANANRTFVSSRWRRIFCSLFFAAAAVAALGTIASRATGQGGSPNQEASLCDSGIIQNGGFETGSFPPWVIDGTNATPVVTNTLSHSGTFFAFAGDAPDGFCLGTGGEANGDSSFYEQFTGTGWWRHAEFLALGLHQSHHSVRLTGCLHYE